MHCPRNGHFCRAHHEFYCHLDMQIKISLFPDLVGWWSNYVSYFLRTGGGSLGFLMHGTLTILSVFNA